jgi:hypothetical protein
MHTRKDVGRVGFDLHPSTAAITLLSPPQVTIDESLIKFQAGGQSGQEGDQSFAMGLSCGEVAQHKFSILNDKSRKSGTRRREINKIPP